ncbi:MAG: hypothetical protein HUU26_02505 [Gemmatimonadaceae bacterium]|nr:hypothetical protein [Gemmatimonadaceae bacterium]
MNGTDEGPRPAHADAYRLLILAELPRALSLMDRESGSRTSGCCDRTYWAWKFTDFPGARFQEAVCCLAYAWATPFEANRFHRSARVLEWLTSAVRFWRSLQHADGSFDEAYPYERSLAATAFTTFYVGEGLRWLGAGAPTDLRDAATTAIRRAAAWLCVHDETHGVLSNHLAAAAGALEHAHQLTGEARFRQRGRYFVDRILARQSSEGWYEEYGGADPGYQTHGSFYLARYWEMTGSADVLESLRHATRFLAHFVHPDGSVSGEYASRNTKTYYPAAFEMLAPHDPAASWIAGTMRRSVTGSAAAGLGSVDVYNFFPLLNNLVFAFDALRREGPSSVQPHEPGASAPLVWFPQAGIARIRRPRYDAVVGTAKGGVIKIYDRAQGRLAYSDCGYVGRLRDGRRAASQFQDSRRRVDVAPEAVEVETAFAVFHRPTMTPLRFIAFRCATLTLGRFAGVGRLLKRLLVSVLIYRRRMLALTLKRRIRFHDDRVEIADDLGGPDGCRFVSLRWEPTYTTIHMGSARYFVDNELADPPVEGDLEPVDPRRLTGGVSCTRVVRFG